MHMMVNPCSVAHALSSKQPRCGMQWACESETESLNPQTARPSGTRKPGMRVTASASRLGPASAGIRPPCTAALLVATSWKSLSASHARRGVPSAIACARHTLRARSPAHRALALKAACMWLRSCLQLCFYTTLSELQAALLQTVMCYIAAEYYYTMAINRDWPHKRVKSREASTASLPGPCASGAGAHARWRAGWTSPARWRPAAPAAPRPPRRPRCRRPRPRRAPRPAWRPGRR